MPPGLGDTLQARGDIDAIAHQVAVALLDHIAKMDADAELDAPLGRQAGIALGHAVLHLDGAANGIDDASELNEDAIAGPLNDATMMQSDGRVDQIAAQRAQPRKRPLLVGSRQACCIRLHPPQEWLRVSGSRPWLPFTTRETSTIAHRPGQVV